MKLKIGVIFGGRSVEHEISVITALQAMDNIDKESEIYRMAKSSIIARADSFVNSTNSSPYGVAISKFNWGSNMTVANAGVTDVISIHNTSKRLKCFFMTLSS